MDARSYFMANQLGRRQGALLAQLERLTCWPTATKVHPTYISVIDDFAEGDSRFEMTTTYVFHLAACQTCGETFASRLRIIERNELRSLQAESTELASDGECRCCRDATLNRQRVARHRAKHRQEKQPITCEHCGTSFTPKRSTAQFCSTRCRVAASRAKA
ncbi:hypothetical protein FQK07_09720 [Synechococcus sp. BSF8S]|uniref:hypothetical protein n=1 Tax=Synechococcales TaxID=1890424 RepID=UPI0016281F01|nr:MULTISPECIES: hypothetical protein [unclassified Synechococcus]MBC1261542.1 hypothetical protein [Synechococcus sp. BSF8S]MBC1264319.1 hypothetical protein [Synechococcus sp. BSA11S]